MGKLTPADLQHIQQLMGLDTSEDSSESSSESEEQEVKSPDENSTEAAGESISAADAAPAPASQEPQPEDSTNEPKNPGPESSDVKVSSTDQELVLVRGNGVTLLVVLAHRFFCRMKLPRHHLYKNQ